VRDVADPIVVRHESIDLDAPGVGSQDAGQDLDGRGLPCSVGSDEAEQLPLRERERDVRERFDAPATTTDDPFHGADETGRSLRHEVRLGEALDDDLRQPGLQVN
jgi:hypothetical protein